MSAGKVLVVDDEPEVQRVLREFLSSCSHEVTVADDGMAALTLVEIGRPDLLLLDVGDAGHGWSRDAAPDGEGASIAVGDHGHRERRHWRNLETPGARRRGLRPQAIRPRLSRPGRERPDHRCAGPLPRTGPSPAALTTRR